jgi:nickel/cobalt transporter (NicO) family protein
MLIPSGRHSVRRSAFALVFLMITAAQTTRAQTVDVFGRTSSGAPGAVQAPAPQNGAEPRVAMLEPVRRAIAAGVNLQGRLNAQLQDQLAEQRNGASMLAAWTLMLLSFGYGVLHALGPGHGKMVVSTYLMSHRARVGHAIALSVWSACVQAISAICLVGSAAWLAHEGLGGVLTQAATLDLVSYVSLLCVGLVTVWSIVTRRDCCDEGRITLIPKRRAGLFAIRRDNNDSQHGRYLGASSLASRRAPNWTRVDEKAGNVWISRQIVMTGLAVGVRPCVGAIFVLIAALANGMFLVGVLSAFAMAAGVSLTVLTIGLASLGINRVVSSRSVARRQVLAMIRTRLALAGAVIITLFAAWRVLALLSGWQLATLA